MPQVSTWIGPVIDKKFVQDVQRILAFNPTENNPDSANYVDQVRTLQIHHTIKTTIENLEKAIKSLSALNSKISEKRRLTSRPPRNPKCAFKVNSLNILRIVLSKSAQS